MSNIEWTDVTWKRFWSKVQIAHVSECWEWQAGCFSNGYGQFRVGERKVRAHRVVYEASHGPIPDGLCVLHKCDNPKCVNVGHLFLGTHGDNARDRSAKGRSARRNLPVLRGTDNPAAKLTPEQVRSIRYLRAGARREWTLKRLAERFGISSSQVRNIVEFKSWRTPTHA